MVIRQALPFDFAPRGRRISAKTTLIVGVSLGVHALVAGYLAMMQFAPPKAPPAVEERLLALEIYTPPKSPPPPEPDTKPQPPKIRVHAPVPQAAPSIVEPLRVDPIPEPPQTIGPLASLTPVPDPPAPRTPEIGNPTWLKRPGASEFARFYPDRAQRMEQEGTATITCAVTAAGSLTGCRVVRETPGEFGFGAATLKLAQYFKMSPRTVDGRPVEGGQVTIPIRFNLD
jgi:periplasmic protein TonB